MEIIKTFGMSVSLKGLLFLFLLSIPLISFAYDENYSESKIDFKENFRGADSLDYFFYSKLINFGFDFHLGGGHMKYIDSHLRTKSRFHFAMGFMTRFNFSPRLAFQLNSLYDYNSYPAENGNLRRHSLTFPATIQLFFPSEEDIFIRPGIYAGPYLRSNFNIRDPEDHMPLKDHYYKNEVGLKIGVFFEGYGFRMGFSTMRALTDVNKIGDFTGRANSNYFSIGLIF